MSKRRPNAHVIGDQAIEIVKSVLPKEWVIRELKPDYGIDLLIELFDYVNAEKNVCETLGEFIYIQVKGTSNLTKRKVKIYAVHNVAKFEWKENKNEYLEIEAIIYSLDTSLLDTVRRVGPSVPVLLFVVDTITKEVFSICLNDILDKYIIPKYSNFTDQNKINIHIPADNKIDGSFFSLVPIRMYAKRSKLYSAFALFRYQLRELNRAIEEYEPIMMLTSDENMDKYNNFLKLIRFFLDQILKLDIWSIDNHLLALGICKQEIDALVTYIYKTEVFELNQLINLTLNIWSKLDNLNNIYEEVCREWFLPKFIGQLAGDPSIPIIKLEN